MKNKFALLIGLAVVFLFCGGSALALQTFSDQIAVPSLIVGEQGIGGVTYFNGTIVNSTVNGEGEGQPVTFGDDVRIDGAIQRGHNGDGDAWPVKINDSLMVYGDITATGDINGVEKSDVDGLISTLTELEAADDTFVLKTSPTWAVQTGVASVSTAGCVTANTNVSYSGYRITLDPSENYHVTLECPVQLPDGATVTGFTANIGDSSSKYIVAYLEKTDVTDSILTSSFLASTSSQYATSGYNRISDTSINNATVDNENNTYYVHVIFMGGGDSITDLYYAGAKVNYTFTQPY